MAWGGGWEEYEENTRNVKRTIARTVQKSWGRGILEILRFIWRESGAKVGPERYIRYWNSRRNEETTETIYIYRRQCDYQSNKTINKLCAMRIPRSTVGHLSAQRPKRPEFCEPAGWVGFCRFEADQNIFCRHRQVIIVLFSIPNHKCKLSTVSSIYIIFTTPRK